MTKRILFLFLCCTLALFSVSALSGCGKDEDDLISEGLTYIENGQYKKARNVLEKAAQDDPENIQAKETYQIVDRYLKAKEAHELGDDAAASEYLENLPERYENLPISDDIRTLLRSLKSSLPDNEKSKSKSNKNSSKNKSEENKDIFSAQEEIDMQLQIAQNLADAGLYSNALEVLDETDMTYARSEQKTQYNTIREDAEKGGEQAAANEEANPEQKEFTSQKALEYLKNKYPNLSGDPGIEGLPAKYDTNGQKYYELTFQHENDIITAQIFANGMVVEKSRQSA